MADQVEPGLTAEESKAFNEMKSNDKADKDALHKEKIERNLPPEEPEEKPEQKQVKEKPVKEEKKNDDLEEVEDKPEKPKKKGAVNELIEERKARQEAERRAIAAEERNKLINEALSTFKQQQQAQINNQPPPDPDKDPMAAIKYLQQKNQEYAEYINTDRMKRQQATEQLQLDQRAQMAERDFAASVDDYKPAVDFLIATRAKQMAIMGMQPMQIEEQMRNEARALAMQAFQKGQNPAQLLYQMAISIPGYQKPQAQRAIQEQQQEQAQAAENLNQAADKLSRIAEGQRATASLGNVSGGSGGNNKVSARQIASMTDDEFAEAYSKMSKSQKREVFGE